MLRTCLVFGLVSVLGGTITARAQSTESLTAAERSGRKIFQTRCSMCHVGQDPATELATDSDKPRQWTFGPLLSQRNAADEGKLRDKITNGGPRMPGYKLSLSAEQIGQVIAFMKTLERPLTKLAAAGPGE